MLAVVGFGRLSRCWCVGEALLADAVEVRCVRYELALHLGHALAWLKAAADELSLLRGSLYFERFADVWTHLLLLLLKLLIGWVVIMTIAHHVSG